MSDRSSVLVLEEPPPTKDPLATLLKYPIASLAPPKAGGCTTNSAGRLEEGNETNEVSLAKLILLLSPEHQHILETMVRELANLEGIEVPALPKAKETPEPLSQYIPIWQNSLATRGFSAASMSLYRYNVERLLANVPPPITTIAIEGYTASRREILSPNALKNELKAAKSFFGFLHDRGIIPSDPAAKVRHPKIVRKPTVFPTTDEMAKFLAVLALAQNPKAKLMMGFFINTGIRFTEMATLTWGKINLESREITVLGKGSKVRTIPIAQPLRDFLAELRNDRDDAEMVFPSESKKGKWDNSDANKMIARLCRRAGIRRYTCHQFRHYFATYTRKAGAPLKVVQELLGHKHAAITLDFYDHTDEEEIRKAHETFAPLLGEVLRPKKERGGSDGQTD